MTNAEKYKEVFGVAPDRSECARSSCDGCPANMIGHACSYTWWNEEYKGANNG